MVKVNWTEIAQFDLENIGDYIAENAPLYALELIENIIDSTRKLTNHPRIGRVVPEFEDENLRELIFCRPNRLWLSAQKSYLDIGECSSL